MALAMVGAGCKRAEQAGARAEPASPAPPEADEAAQDEPEPGSDEMTEGDDADVLFAKGVEAERAGKLAAAARWFEEACGAGLGTACGRLGDMYSEGRGVPADDDRAHSLFEQGCALGSARACDAVGH